MLALLLLALASLSYLGYSISYLESGAWKRQRRRLGEIGAEMGLTPVEAAAATVTGRLEGLPFSVGLYKYQGSRTKGYQLRAELKATQWSGVVVDHEGLFSGAQRWAGQREIWLGDREVDACFWLEGQQDTLRRLFTSPTREGLLRELPEIPGGSLKDGKVTCELVVLTPFFLARRVSQILQRFQRLAAALQGSGPVQLLPEGFVVGRKLRRFAGASLGILAPLFLLSVALPGPAGLAAQAVSGLGLGLSALALAGRQTVRLLLQAYYAFLTVGLSLLTVLAASTLVWDQQARLSEVLAAVLFGLVLTGLCWSARHYMRALDLSGVNAPPEQPPTF